MKSFGVRSKVASELRLTVQHVTETTAEQENGLF